MTNLTVSSQTFETFQNDPRVIFGSMGLRYIGRQALGRGRPDAYLFDAPDNSTLMLDGPITTESVQAKLDEHNEIVRKFNASLTDEQMVAAIQAHEGEIQW